MSHTDVADETSPPLGSAALTAFRGRHCSRYVTVTVSQTRTGRPSSVAGA